jgi:transcriptional regulator with XRE-family HTH domain
MLYKNLIGAEIRKRRDRLGWSQSDLAVRLQLAGWDIDRSQLSKIECRLVHISDFEQLYFVRVFKVSLSDLLPNVDPQEKINDFLARTMERKRGPIPRGKRPKKMRAAKKNRRVPPGNSHDLRRTRYSRLLLLTGVPVIRGDGLNAVSL